jgi:hypothetical protein
VEREEEEEEEKKKKKKSLICDETINRLLWRLKSKKTGKQIT